MDSNAISCVIERVHLMIIKTFYIRSLELTRGYSGIRTEDHQSMSLFPQPKDLGSRHYLLIFIIFVHKKLQTSIESNSDCWSPKQTC